jgi:hypothetical protein
VLRFHCYILSSSVLRFHCYVFTLGFVFVSFLQQCLRLHMHYLFTVYGVAFGFVSLNSSVLRVNC